MFNFLVSASLRNRLFVLGAALILVVYGAMTLRNLPVDVFPDLNRPSSRSSPKPRAWPPRRSSSSLPSRSRRP